MYVCIPQLDEYSSTQGLLVLRGFGPVTVVIAILGLSASATRSRTLLLVVGHARACTHTHMHTNTHAHPSPPLSPQYSALVFVVFLALMIVSAPLIQVQTQVKTSVYCPLLSLLCIHYC